MLNAWTLGAKMLHQHLLFLSYRQLQMCPKKCLKKSVEFLGLYSLYSLHMASKEALGHSTLLYTTLCYSTLLYATLRYSSLLYAMLRYTTLLYSTLLYSTLHYSTLLYAMLLYSTLLYSTLLYSTLLNSTLLYSTRLDSTRRYFTLLCTTLCYSTLYNNPSFSRILIGSCLWSIRRQMHDWRHHYRVFASAVL